MRNSPEDVDGYTRAAPQAVRANLVQLRKLIRAAAPKADERIGYGMSYYGYEGQLTYFQDARNHIGLYVPPPVVEEHKQELKDYETARATVRFPNDEPLPVALVKKLIRARMKRNEEGRRSSEKLHRQCR